MTSGKYPGIPGPGYVLEQWTLEQLVDANLIIDMYDDLERRSQAKIRAARKAKEK